MTTSIEGDGLAGLTLRKRTPVSGRGRATDLPPGLQKYLQTAEASLAEPFKGVTTDGRVVPGLFQLGTTGVSTQPIADADTARSRADAPIIRCCIDPAGKPKPAFDAVIEKAKTK